MYTKIACTQKLHVHIRNSHKEMLEKERKRTLEQSSRHSVDHPFVWKEISLLHGEKCYVEKDKKRPDHWRESNACTTSEQDPNMLIY